MKKLRENILEILSLYKSEIIGLSLLVLLMPLVTFTITFLLSSPLGLAIVSTVMVVLSLALLIKLT